VLVRDRMREAVTTLGPAASLAEAARALGQSRLGALPVVEGGRLVGVVRDEDVAAALPSPATTLDVREVAYHTGELSVAEVMHRDVLAVGPDTPLADALRLLHDDGAPLVPVLEGATLVGALVGRDLLDLAHDLP